MFPELPSIPLGFEFNLLDQIKLRECEIRLRNAEALRVALFAQTTVFPERHVLNPWAAVRNDAIEIMTAAQACVDEFTAIAKDVVKVPIPILETVALERQKATADAAGLARDLVEPILRNIAVVIENEDARA